MKPFFTLRTLYFFLLLSVAQVALGQKKVTLNPSSNYTWTVPAGVTTVTNLELWGGGGAGGQTSNGTGGTGGGGSGSNSTNGGSANNNTGSGGGGGGFPAGQGGSGGSGIVIITWT